jgi:hypothetical protein
LTEDFAQFTKIEVGIKKRAYKPKSGKPSPIKHIPSDSIESNSYGDEVVTPAE